LSRRVPTRTVPLRAVLATLLIVSALALAACSGSQALDLTDVNAAAVSTPQAADQSASDPASSTAAPSPTPAPVFGQAPTGPVQESLVVGVVDGDTIDVEVHGTVYRVRYIGMDTPETRNGVEWMGAEAAIANESLVAGQRVVLETDVSETDQYGRLLRYVWVEDGGGWLLVNLELLRLGYAQISTYPPDVKYADALYLAAEHEARSAGLGLWGTPPTPVPTPSPVPTPVPPPAAPQPIAPPIAPPSSCHPSYTGGCLAPGIGDYDCAGGSGNGPNYIAGPITVVGYDEYELDRDGDGIACEGG